MNSQNINQIHQNILNIYKNNNIDKEEYIKSKKITDPIFNPKNFHDEERPILQNINLDNIEILHDLLLIGNEIKFTALKYNQLINKTRLDLFQVEKDTYKALEYKKDMLLYNTENIINIEDYDCYGEFFFQNACFTLPVYSENKNSYTIKNIVGNGYEGNKYVVSDNKLDNMIVDTSNRSNLINNNYYAPYEYSRINVYDDTELINNNFNYGNTEAKCMIDIEFQNPSTMLLLTMYGEPIKIKQVEISNDGVNYNAINQEEAIVRLDKLIHYPSSKFIRLHLESTKPTLETIGSFENEKDNKSIIKPTISRNNIKIQKDAKRHRISIANIKTNAVKYLPAGSFKTRELIEENEEVEAIAFDAKILNPTKSSKVKFHFIINGKTTEVSPLSSTDDNIKIIKNNLRTYEEDRSIFIGEPITSAYLVTSIEGGSDNYSPVIEDLKILKY